MQKFCGNCGSRFEDNAKVCGFCGTPRADFSESMPVNQATNQPQSQSQTQNAELSLRAAQPVGTFQSAAGKLPFKLSKKIIVIGAAALTVIIGIVIAIICACSTQSVDDVAKAVVDAEFGCTSVSVMKQYAKVLPDEYLDYLVEQGGGWLWDNEEEWIEYQYREYSEDTEDYMAQYGRGYRYDYRIIDEYKYESDEYYAYARNCIDYGFMPKEVRDVTIKVRATGGGYGNDYTITITVVKIGSSWYLMKL